MKIKDILTENTAPLVAKQHMETDPDFDAFFNPQATMFAEMNREYYKEYFKEFFTHGVTPVFTNADNHVDTEATEWDNKPEGESRQSAGYRGQQNALHKAGVPHDNDVQGYNSNEYMPDVSTQDLIQ